jgi:spore maturation protein CgeB
MQKKRILSIGAGGTYCSIAPLMAIAFRDLGHEAEHCSFPSNQKSKALLRYRVLSRTPFQVAALSAYNDYKENQGELYLRKIEAYKPDMIFITDFGDITPQQIKKIHDSYGVPVVWWAQGGDEAYVSNFNPFNADLVTYASHIFVADTAWVDTLRLLGSAKIYYMPPAAHPGVFKPVPAQKKYDISIAASFVGDVPTVIHKGLILSRLCRDGFRVQAIARGIPKRFEMFPELAKLDYVDEYYNQPEVNILYNETRINLSLANPQHRSGPHFRVMEIAAGRNFQLTEYREDLEMLLGDTVPSFKTLDEMVELARFYLTHETERERLATESYERVMRDHTTIVRAKKILEEVFTK